MNIENFSVDIGNLPNNPISQSNLSYDATISELLRMQPFWLQKLNSNLPFYMGKSAIIQNVNRKILMTHTLLALDINTIWRTLSKTLSVEF